jgi:hypothetical protein
MIGALIFTVEAIRDLICVTLFCGAVLVILGLTLGVI